MSDSTGIQWTDSTWNVVTGCTRVSPGCARCYIERTPPFRMSRRRFASVGGGESSTGVTLHWDRLAKVPRGPKVFTPSLGDLFHEAVPDTFVAEVFDVMRLHPDRAFQVLTKRPERARDWFARYATAFERFLDGAWPLPNVWLGVSIENSRYTWRADVLREIPAAVRFISAEPLLGSLYDGRHGVRAEDAARVSVLSDVHGGDLSASRAGGDGSGCADAYGATTSDPVAAEPEVAPGDARIARGRASLDLTGIDWVIVGGESGPRARPFHLEHAREIIEAATRERAEVVNGTGALQFYVDGPAVFVKQLGAKPIDGASHRVDDPRAGSWSWTVPLDLRDRKGGDWSEWPADLRIREFPRSAA